MTIRFIIVLCNEKMFKMIAFSTIKIFKMFIHYVGTSINYRIDLLNIVYYIT